MPPPDRRRGPWEPHHAVQTDAAEMTDHVWIVSDLRDFYISQTGERTEHWRHQVPIDTREIVRTWYLLEPFSRYLPIAHPYLIFERENGGAYCFSIEARRKKGESFSIFWGSLNRYELGYFWISERDCFTLPLGKSSYALYLTPLTLSAKESQDLCTEFLQGTHTLYTTPVYYNAIFHNCVSVFYDALRKIRSLLPHHISGTFTGLSDSFLRHFGLIALGKEELRAHSRDLRERSNELWELFQTERAGYLRAIAKLIEGSREQQ